MLENRFKMYNFLIISVLINLTHQTIVSTSNVTNKIFISHTYKYDDKVNLMVNETTEQYLQYTEDTNNLHIYPTRVHVSSNDTINGEYPLFITATQQKGISSWELPLMVETSHSVMIFNDMARTLCPHDAGPMSSSLWENLSQSQGSFLTKNKERLLSLVSGENVNRANTTREFDTTSLNRPTIQITTSSPKNISVDIKVRRVLDFYVEVDKEINLNVTPSTPKYYYFSFDNNPWNVTAEQNHGFLPRFNYTIPKSVLLIIESDDEVCAVVSIQNNSCPVFDNEKDIQYQGYHLTMTTKGGITLTQSMFPVGFYVVFIVKQRDEECTGVSETISGYEMDSWDVEGSGDDGRVKRFRFKIIATISYKEYVAGAMIFLALIALIALFAFAVYIPTCGCSEEVIITEETPGPSSSRETANEDVPILDKDDDSITDSEPEWASAMPRLLTVAELSRRPAVAQDRRSNRYFWSAMTVAVVYALPVVQLLSTYQHMITQTGDQDLCYYNFLCANPLGFLSDFNHVFSNVGYILLGLVFMLQVRIRQLRGRGAPRDVGIPQHHGLFYTMGLCLVMEGVLSGCYHLCPNKMNFQFDSSFMYVIAVVCMVKLYQGRHPDVNANAHSTFMLLAFLMAIGVYGIMYPSVYFWVFITILHLATCFMITMKIYYVGKFKLERSIVRRAWVAGRTHGRYAFVPDYKARAILLAVANAANWALAIYGLYEHNKDFARHLLGILMGNTILYTLFYVIMKLVHRETILPHTWLHFVLAHIAWFVALRLFQDSRTKWSETPAQSRRHNEVCSALQFLDSHDLWHAASAAAMFLSFNLLLSVDDAECAVHRHLIHAF